MSEILKQSEIDELLQELKQIIKRPPITKIKPSEINKITDEKEKEKVKKNFELVNYLYISPLEKVIDYVYKQNNNQDYKYDYGDTSILKRIKNLEITLLRMGYSVDQIISLVPKSINEIEILLNAKSKGFQDNYAINNESRVSSAKYYLNSLNTDEKLSTKGVA